MHLQPDEVQRRAGVSQWVDRDRYHPSYNVGPTRYQPVLRETHDTKERILHSMVFPSSASEQR